MVEFALILPVMLLVIFVIIELARLLHAYVTIENGARFGVRYAVTGEFNPVYCPGGVCTTNAEEDAARLLSIKDTTRAGSTGILRNESVPQGTPGYFKMTVCSSRDFAPPHPDPDFIWFPSDPAAFIPADCQPTEDAGGPGDRVSVTVDFDHPLIVPLLSTYWPMLHLTAKREGIIEQFRVARVIGLPVPILLNTFTPTTPPTATDTPIPTDTSTPTITPTPSDTPTPTDTSTPTTTATATATPSCALLSMGSLTLLPLGGAAWVYAPVTNSNTAPMSLTGSTVDWTKFYGGQVFDMAWFNGTYYRLSADPSPPSSDIANIALAGGGTGFWYGHFSGLGGPGLVGDVDVDLTFNGICSLSASLSIATPTPTNTATITLTPSRTPTPTITYTPSITLTPSQTLTPSLTPTRTNTPTPSNTPTRTNTPTPSNTPTPTRTPTNTPTPSDTPTPTSTATRTPSWTPSPTSAFPTPTETETPTPSRTPACMEC